LSAWLTVVSLLKPLRRGFFLSEGLSTPGRLPGIALKKTEQPFFSFFSQGDRKGLLKIRKPLK